MLLNSVVGQNVSVWALQITAIQRLCWFILPASDIWRFSLHRNCWSTKLQWQLVLLAHVSSADNQLLHGTHALEDPWGQSYAVNLVQHKSILPLKFSAVSSLLVPSAPLKLAPDSLNPKPHARMNTFPFSLPCPHADPHTAWFFKNRNTWEEHSSSLWQMQIRMHDVATEQKPRYKDFNTPTCQTQGRFICLLCTVFRVWSCNVYCWLKLIDTGFSLIRLYDQSLFGSSIFQQWKLPSLKLHKKKSCT